METERILVIEDENFIRDNVLELLQLQGYEVRGAANGIEGIEIAREWNPQLILCDLFMPKGDGYSVIAATQLFCNPPRIIILTASGDNENLLKLQEMGIRFILKPFNMNQLIVRVKEGLRGV